MVCPVSRGVVFVYTDLVFVIVVNSLRRWGVVITRRPTTVRWLVPPISPLLPHYCAPAAGASTGPLFIALTFPYGVACFYLSCCPFSVRPTGFHSTMKESCFSTRLLAPALAYVGGKHVVLWDKLTLATLLTNEVNCWSVKNADCCRVGYVHAAPLAFVLQHVSASQPWASQGPSSVLPSRTEWRGVFWQLALRFPVPLSCCVLQLAV